MVISGISSCVKNISAFRKSAEAFVISFGSSFPFAPGTTTILFWPSSPVLINATPDDPFTVPTPFTSTPALRSAPFSAEPNESSPTFPTMLTGWPSLATPTAWLAPFPPWKVEKVRPVRVSPGSGTRSPAATKSKFMLPTTTICLRIDLRRSLSVAKANTIRGRRRDPPQGRWEEHRPDPQTQGLQIYGSSDQLRELHLIATSISSSSQHP